METAGFSATDSGCVKGLQAGLRACSNGTESGAGFLEPVRAKSYPEVDLKLVSEASYAAGRDLLLRIVPMLVAMVRRDSGSGTGTGTGRGTEEKTAREPRDSPA